MTQRENDIQIVRDARIALDQTLAIYPMYKRQYQAILKALPSSKSIDLDEVKKDVSESIPMPMDVEIRDHIKSSIFMAIDILYEKGIIK